MKYTGTHIRALRMGRQIKQATVAKKMGITVQRYSQLENRIQLPDERITEIITILGFTEESAESFLKFIISSASPSHLRPPGAS
jgi:transcriptional regulator with XRE-family HTH domain